MRTLSGQQNEIMEKLYEYLGFNECMEYNTFLENFFNRKWKLNIGFESVFNYNLRNIVEAFWEQYPQYKVEKYIKFFWLEERNMIKHLKVGHELEFDPKGVVRLYVKNHYKFT